MLIQQEGKFYLKIKMRKILYTLRMLLYALPMIDIKSQQPTKNTKVSLQRTYCRITLEMRKHKNDC